MKRAAYYLFGVTALVSIPLLPVFAEQLKNPLGDTNEPNELVANVIRTSLGVIGGLTLLVLVYGGFLMLTSVGNSEKLNKAKETLMWATIGLIVIFGAWGISDALFKVLSGETL